MKWNIHITKTKLFKELKNITQWECSQYTHTVKPNITHTPDIMCDIVSLA